MIEKAMKIAQKLSKSPIVSYEHLPNSSRFKMVSKSGVKWSSRSTKLGNIHYYKNHVYLAIDFPSGEVTETYVFEKLDYPSKSPGEKKTGFYISDAPETGKFGTIRISIYEEELSKMDFNDSILIDFIAETFQRSMA